MNLVRFHNPYYRFNMNSMLNDLLSNNAIASSQVKAQGRPAVNISDLENAYELEFSVPGYAKESFNIKSHEGKLIVKAEVEAGKDTNGYTRKEYSVQSFERKFQLPDTVVNDLITAKYEHGILTVTIPKQEVSVQPKEIAIAVQ